MKNNSTSSTAFDGFAIGKSSGSSSSRLKQANHSGLTPKATGSVAVTKGNPSTGKNRQAPSGLEAVVSRTVKPKNCGC